jgi:hypothetical protein
MISTKSALLEMFSVTSGTWTVIILLAICALSAIRGAFSNTLTAVGTFPLIIFCSLACYHTARTLMWFNEEKMADWHMWTVMCGSAGTMLAISFVAFAGRLLDRPTRTA